MSCPRIPALQGAWRRVCIGYLLLLCFSVFWVWHLQGIVHLLPVSSPCGKWQPTCWNGCGVQAVTLQYSTSVEYWLIPFFKSKLGNVSHKQCPDRCFLRHVVRKAPYKNQGTLTRSVGEECHWWNNIWEMLPTLFLFWVFTVHIIKLRVLESLSGKNPA